MLPWHQLNGQAVCSVLRKVRPFCKAEHNERKQKGGEVCENVRLGGFFINQARSTHRKTISG